MRALAALTSRLPSQADRLQMDLRAYTEGRRGLAATLRELNVTNGGEFYVVPAEAEMDDQAADETFDGEGVVIDVQTHLIPPTRATTGAAASVHGFMQTVDQDRWGGGIDPSLLSAPEWASLIFGRSETAVALLTSLPGPPDDNVLTNAEIAGARDIVERYAGTGRVLTHTIVHPNLGAQEIDSMVAWREQLKPSGWKVYTLWEPPNTSASRQTRQGWFLDDDTCGIPFLEQVRAIGPRIVCAHKGIAGPIRHLAPSGSSPRDIGPAAKMFPDITFVVYHSGYDIDLEGEEAEHRLDPYRGVSRLVTSLEEAGIGPGNNVYAELGSTWFITMRRPREAAHILGKLLKAVGPDRILWGTDSIWYGSPQFLIDAFRAFTIPERMQNEFGYDALTDDIKISILGHSAAAVYGVDLGRARTFSRSDNSIWLARTTGELATRLP
jgi:predicted TIM-barrel fold metal-dependent hydrolase